MYRTVVGAVLAVSLTASGSALAVETAVSPASPRTQTAARNKSGGTAKTVRHSRKSGDHKRIAHMRGLNANPRTTEPLGSAGSADLPVVSPQQKSAPSETPWTGFHVGVEGGRGGR